MVRQKPFQSRSGNLFHSLDDSLCWNTSWVCRRADINNPGFCGYLCPADQSGRTRKREDSWISFLRLLFCSSPNNLGNQRAGYCFVMISPFQSRPRKSFHGSMRIPSSSILELSSLDTTMYLEKMPSSLSSLRFARCLSLTYSHGQAPGNLAMVTTAAPQRASYTVSGPRDPSGLALWSRRPSPFRSFHIHCTNWPMYAVY